MEANIKDIRDKFFKECTHPEKYDELKNQFLPKIIMAPHDLFEWFRPYLKSIDREISDKEIEEHFELSESQCQDPYSIAKQEGQIAGAKWMRSQSPVRINNLINEAEAIEFADWLPLNAAIVSDNYYWVSLDDEKPVAASELYKLFKESKK